MNKTNYQKELEKTIENNINENITPRLLLHACCAPCSSYVLEYLSKYFEIDVLFYNPNISTTEEYNHRAEELIRFINEMEFQHSVKPIIANYDSKEFYEYVKGYEKAKEGGERCFKCYRLRLEFSGKYAKDNGYDYFTTTLSISPLKNAQKLNEIGKEISEKYNIDYLFSDFKKKNGYKRSIELSKEHNLYRQNFCGCVFSKRDE